MQFNPEAAITNQNFSSQKIYVILLSFILILLAIVVARIFNGLASESELEERINELKPQLNNTLVTVRNLQKELDSIKKAFNNHNKSLAELNHERDSLLFLIKFESLKKLSDLDDEKKLNEKRLEELMALRNRNRNFE